MQQVNKIDIKLLKQKYQLQPLPPVKKKNLQGQQYTLYFARNINTKQQFIVKSTKDNILGYRQKQMMQLFQGSLNIIQLHKYIQEEQLIVMEKGQCDLRQYIKKAWPIPDKVLQQITLNIVNGLQIMHNHPQQCWHRDLKPQNIFLFSKNKKPFNYKNDQNNIIAKIGDLGSARQLVKGEQEEVILTTGSSVGTQVYRCKQLIMDETYYNNKIDIWSLAIILFELYSGTNYIQYFRKNRKSALSKQGCQRIIEYMFDKLDKIESNQKDNIKKIIENTIKQIPQKRISLKEVIKILKIQPVNNKISQKNQKLLSNLNDKLKTNTQLFESVKLTLDKTQYLIKTLSINPNPKKSFSNEPHDDNLIIMKSTFQINLKQQAKSYSILMDNLNQIIKKIQNAIKLIKQFKTDAEITKSNAQITNLQTKLKNQINKYTKSRSKQLDLCFLIDATGSMQSLIQNVINNIIKIQSKIIQQASFQSIRFACVAYRDFDCKPNQMYQIYDFASSEQILSKIKNIKAFGGGDNAEDVNGGLQKTLKLKWESYSKLILHFTDAPAHQKKYNGHTSDNDDDFLLKIPPSDISYKKIFRQLKSAGINYYLVQIRKVESLNFMYNAFEQQYKDAECYRARSNTLGQMKYIDHISYQNASFVDLITQVGVQVNLLTTKNLKSKRRAPGKKQEYEKQFGFDRIKDKQQFIN